MSRKELLQIIRFKQAILNKKYVIKGATDPEVYRLSCELDELITRYMKAS